MADEAIQLRCHHCSRYLGEALQLMECVAIVKAAGDRQLVDPPRDSRRCRACGWTNVFKALDTARRL